MSGLSQISGSSRSVTIAETTSAKEQVRRECRQELGDGLGEKGDLRAQADPDAYRHPDQAGERDERQHAHHGHQAENRRRTRLGRRKADDDEATDLPEGRCRHGENETGPQAIAPGRFVLMGRGLGMPCAAGKPYPIGSTPQEREGPGQGCHDDGIAEDVQHPGLRCDDPCLLLEPETVRPGDERPKEQLVVEQDDHQHGGDRPADRREVLPLDGQGDV